MKVLVANIEDVMREASARWTLITYFLLSSIFILIFASAINLDIVDGALAGAKLFGKDVGMNENVTADTWQRLVLGFESGFSVFFLYPLCTFLAVFATAHLVPRMQDKGTIDLYLSRPVARVKLILSRYLAGLILAGSNLAYLIIVTWAIMSWKTHVVQPRFFLGGAVIFFTIAMLMAFAFLVGVITSSTAVSIMSTFAVAIFGLMLSGHARMEAMVSKEWQAAMIKTFYWVFPKTAELGASVFLFVAGDHIPRGFDFQLSWTPFLTTGAFGIVCLVLASWLFTRKEF